MMMMPRRGRAQTAYFFEELPFSETDHDVISLNTFSDTPTPVLWPGNKDEDPSLHPRFYDVSDVFELIQRSKPARHPLTRREPVHIHELHPILYPGADLERYLNTVKLLCERLKSGPEREALFNEALGDLDAYFKPHHSEDAIHDTKKKEIIERLRGEFEQMPSRASFKRGRDSSSTEEEDESSSDDGSDTTGGANRVADEQSEISEIIRRQLISKQNALLLECHRSGQNPSVYVWRRDAWLLETPFIFNICNPANLWTIRSNFAYKMGDTYELRVQPQGYANEYADYERDYQQANLLADRFAMLRAILYPVGIRDWNMPFLQDETIEVFENLFTDLSRRNVNLSPSLRMEVVNNIPSRETIQEILNKRFFTDLSGFLIHDGGPRYYIVNPSRPSELVNEVGYRLNIEDRNRLRRRWRTSVEVATILLTIARRVIPAFVTMTAEQIHNNINAGRLFRYNPRTNMYKLNHEEKLLDFGYRFSDFRDRSLLQSMLDQERMRDEDRISLCLQRYCENLRNN